MSSITFLIVGEAKAKIRIRMSYTNNRSIGQLVDLADNWDKDERFMALNDLWTQLSREDVKISRAEEVRVVDAILKALTDANNDVKSVAVKCVAVLVKKVEQGQIEVICDNLCELIRSEQKDQAELRDIYSIALKTLISDVPDTMGDEVARHLTSKLISGICNPNTGIKKECLVILEDLLERFGTSFNCANHHENIMNQVLRLLALPGHEHKSIRKVSADCLGALALVSSEELLNSMVEILLELIATTNIGEQQESGNGKGKGKGKGKKFQANKRTVRDFCDCGLWVMLEGYIRALCYIAVIFHII
jgi:hypothetical protein